MILSFTASAEVHEKAKEVAEACPARGVAMVSDAPEKVEASAGELAIGAAAMLMA